MSQVNILEALVHPEFFETLDYYQPSQTDFLELATRLVPSDWRYRRNNSVWFQCDPPATRQRPLPPQGWKLHLSSSLSTAQELLSAAIPVLVGHGVSFKFCVDRQMLSFMNSKQWARQGAGKFVTIYPWDEPQFIRLAEELYQATRHFAGPYVLSDRRYKDSKSVYYRYGGIRQHSRLNIQGEQVPLLIGPSGETVPDIRQPYFVVPPWTRDPFAASSPETTSANGEVPLKQGRYLVKSVLRHSNSGGVYIAHDTTTGRDVVIKEARPYIDIPGDPLTLLRKEHRILTKLSPLDLTPKVIDLFQDWEHLFLVEEFIPGLVLSNFGSHYNPVTRTSPTVDDVAEYTRKVTTIVTNLAASIARLHEMGIIFGDLSPSNVIVAPDTLRVTLIDFEGTHEQNVDTPISLVTPGFAHFDQMGGKQATVESDYFAIGAILYHLLWPINQMFLLYPRARYIFIQNIVKDLGFPQAIPDLVTALLDGNPENRPAPSSVVETLARCVEVREPSFEFDGPVSDRVYRSYVEEITRYILAVATYERSDRAFPADGLVFRTNPLSIGYGACGIACALKAMGADIPDRLLTWIAETPQNNGVYPPGMYVGRAGIAWAMLDLGLTERAETVLADAYEHRLLYESNNIFYGVAGWGMASLKFFLATGNQQYLERAVAAGRHLLAVKDRDSRGYYWSAEGAIPLGFAFGGSGIALFLLYLYAVTSTEEFLDAGRQALAFDINCASPAVDGAGLSWKRHADQGNILYPYWIYGSAGVGAAVLRYYRVFPEPGYKEILDHVCRDANRKYTVFPGMFKGLAGLGEFLLDLYAVTRNQEHLEAAYRVATGLSLFKIPKDAGLAFPGDGLRRLSCDFGTGSAGIGLFFHRLTNRSVAGAFQLDSVLDRLAYRPYAAALTIQ